jgi:hypothetical protein
MLRHIKQLQINALEQLHGKAFGGHGLPSPCGIGSVANTLGDKIATFFD